MSYTGLIGHVVWLKLNYKFIIIFLCKNKRYAVWYCILCGVWAMCSHSSLLCFRYIWFWRYRYIDCLCVCLPTSLASFYSCNFFFLISYSFIFSRQDIVRGDFNCLHIFYFMLLLDSMLLTADCLCWYSLCRCIRLGLLYFWWLLLVLFHLVFWSVLAKRLAG